MVRIVIRGAGIAFLPIKTGKATASALSGALHPLIRLITVLVR
jgi:hypothetical protein